MKKTMAIVMVLAGLLIISSACKGGGDNPITPTLPNSFQIVSIDNYGSTDFGSFGVTISYANNTDSSATLTGTFYFGDGASKGLADISSDPAGWTLPAKKSESVEIGRFNHDYASPGTYRVKAEFTVTFKNESIKRTLEVDFQIAVQELSSEIMMR